MATDAPVWEQYKENAAPLERGRNVDTLEMNLRVETEEERQAKENSLRHYESLVRPSEEMATNGEEMGEDDDPLIHWLSYIKFHQDYFPSDKQSQFLLMERCARTLIGQKKYANDIRFVRVCLMYADQTSDPGEIFRYLYSQKVGSTTALFWVAWAFCCEKQGDFKMAEKIFRKGKSKKAHPLSLLESRHKQFERRMARYWMNAQEQGTEEDEDEEQQGGRGVLGPLTEDSFRRNDRASARNMQNTTRARPQQGFPSTNMNTFIDRSAPTAPGGRQLFVDRHNQSRSNNKGTSSHAAGFQIYVEGDQENEDCILDRPGTINARRELPREQDRRKENTLAAERWNERGGLQNTQHYATATVAPPPPSVAAPIQPAQKPMAFPVYVDEDCAAQHQREALLQEAEQERRRRHRDERTFRPLAVGDSVAEQLYQDPLRYVKDPSQIQGDQERAKHVYSDREDDNDTENAVASTSRPTNTYMKLPSGHQEEEKKNSTHQPHSKKNSRATACGFDKSLVSKDDTGQEQCFEEQRANRNYFKTVSSNANFNYLHQPVQGDRSKLMDDSGMEIDDTTTVGDLSMEDAKVNDSVASSQKQSSRRVLFRNDTSFQEPEVSMNNVSQCSSTINSAHAVGVDNPEEETINTKLAFKELSMMFSSPAMGLSSTKNEAKRQKMGEPEIVPGLRHQQQSSFESQQRTSSFVQENRGDGEETADTAAFATIMDLVDSAGRGEEPDNSILRGGGLQADPENVGPRNPLSRANSPQELIDKHALRTLRSDTQAEASLPACQPGSIAPRRVLGQIDQDDPLAQAPANELHNNPGFVIFEDGEEDAESSGVTSTFTKEETMPFSSFRDKEVSKVRKTPSDFQIFEDKESSGEKKASSGFQIFEDKKPSANEGFQIFEDKKESSGFKIHEDCRDQESPRAASDGGDTATLSLMGDLNSILKEGDDSSVGGDQVRIKRTSNVSKSYQINTK